MISVYKRLIFFSFFSIFLLPVSGKVWINEFMQSNIDLVRDDRQEFPDSWVELYNDSNESVNIQGWYLSLESDYGKGWKIPHYTLIQPKGYLLLYCDNEDGLGLHAPFRLESGKGGNIYLFDASGKEVDAVLSIPKHPAPNIAMGRIQDTAAEWVYFVKATPKAQNQGKISSTLLPLPIFSIKGGIYKNSVTVSLSVPANDVLTNITNANIRYTLDCSEPDENSPVYNGSITISSTKVLKAKIIHPDYLSPRSQAHSYIITSKDYALPVVSISTKDEYLNNSEFGIYVKGNGKYGIDINDGNGRCNWNNDWRRPMTFEYFADAKGDAVLNQLGEFRIAGGWSRANAQKSFIVYGNKRFGENKRYDYQFFAGKPGQEIKSFMLRNSGNDFWWTHFRDAAIQLFMGGKVDVDYQAYQPTVFYLNGKYWGILNLRERSDEDFVLANYATEDIDMIENWWGDVKAGDDVAFFKLVDELRKADGQRNMEWIVNQVDVDQFINYMILQIYVANTDFPGNNMAMWRHKTETGKWRFVLKDTDFGLGIWDSNKPYHNTLVYNTGENDRPRRLFNALMTQDALRKKFYERFAVYMGDILSYSSTSFVIDSIRQLIEPEYEDHILRWRNEVWWRDMNSWREEVNKMKTWCSQRNSYMYTHLKDFFSLGNTTKLKIETYGSLKETPGISVNDVMLTKPSFDGSYFRKETLRLKVHSSIGNIYTWEITATVAGKPTTTTYGNTVSVDYYIPENCTDLSVKITDTQTSIGSVASEAKINCYTHDNCIEVQGLTLPSSVNVYDTGGRLIVQLQADSHTERIPLGRKGVYIVKVSSPRQAYVGKVVI